MAYLASMAENFLDMTLKVKITMVICLQNERKTCNWRGFTNYIIAVEAVLNCYVMMKSKFCRVKVKEEIIK
jgi:hypothetical protein